VRVIADAENIMIRMGESNFPMEFFEEFAEDQISKI
jgi:hypothetical protein